MMQRANQLRTATMSAPGTCGELVQGLVNGVPALITCPVELYSTVTISLINELQMTVTPSNRTKTLDAVQRTLRHLDARNVGVTATVESLLPLGKGMASSTADVTAAIAATYHVLGQTPTPEEIAYLAIQVEPSDGVMFPGIALFDHRGGSFCEVLGNAPPMHILVLDFGGSVDTVSFNTSDHAKQLALSAPQVAKAVALVREGMACGSSALIGKGTTLSALANQAILPKPHLPAVLDFANEAGAVGVNVAHSGTVIGVLFDARRNTTAAKHALAAAYTRFPSLQATWLTRLIGGGVQARQFPL